jgi:hypothetical protein
MPPPWTLELGPGYTISKCIQGLDTALLAGANDDVDEAAIVEQLLVSAAFSPR